MKWCWGFLFCWGCSAAPSIEAIDASPDSELSSNDYYSGLFPPDWQPGFTDSEGRFLQDYSFAGYRYGEPLPASGSSVFSVVDFGADSTGVTDATGAVQNTIDAASVAGGVVWFPQGTYRIDGLLVVGASGVVLQGESMENTFLKFTKNTEMTSASSLLFSGMLSTSAETLLTKDTHVFDTKVVVADASELQAGDTVHIGWVISNDFVDEHGMTGTWQAFNNSWRPFFRRKIVAVSGNEIFIDVPIRYPGKVRDGASVRKVSGYLTECGMRDLQVNNTTDSAWSFDQVHVIGMRHVKDCYIENIHSFGTDKHLQSGGVLIDRSFRVTVTNSSMKNSQNRGSGGNGYLFEIRQSNEILFEDLVAENGRHNFIQNWGFGTNGCVFLRCLSRGSRLVAGEFDPIGWPALSEFHHSLATANLIDGCELADGFGALNRRTESSGAGHTATQNVFWNNTGAGVIRSKQFGWGYIVKNHSSLRVDTSLNEPAGAGTEQEDFIEEVPEDRQLRPISLYERQREIRVDAMR